METEWYENDLHQN